MFLVNTNSVAFRLCHMCREMHHVVESLNPKICVSVSTSKSVRRFNMGICKKPKHDRPTKQDKEKCLRVQGKSSYIAQL